MIGSMAALVLGWMGVAGCAGAIGRGEEPATLISAPMMILGALAYRSRRRRHLGLRSDTYSRMCMEGVTLAVVVTAWLGVNDLEESIRNEPIPFLLAPIWALTAYACAGLRTKAEDGPHGRSAAIRRADEWGTILAALIVGAAGATALRGPDIEREPEPARPLQAALNATEPLKLTVTVGHPFEIATETPGQPAWLIPVECRPGTGQAARVADPTASERWLFGTLWGRGGTSPGEPRLYVQAIPELTLAVALPRGSEPTGASSGLFANCAGETERQLLPLLEEHAAALQQGTADLWVTARAMGLPRDDERTAAAVEAMDSAESDEEMFEAMLPLVMGFQDGSLMFPVDGLVNGGPVFTVERVETDSWLSRVPTMPEPVFPR